MEFKKGSSRYVLILPLLGIVVKFPVIYLKRTLKSFLSCFKDKRVLKRFKFFFRGLYKYDIRAFGQPKSMLFLGIVSNWNEFCMYLDNPNDFCVPTYFSLFGLINIQKYEKEKCTLDDGVLFTQLYHLTNGDVWEHPHHFSNAENFCVVDNHLKILDYGAKETCYVLKKHGQKIYERFNLKITKWDYNKRIEEQLVPD